MRKSNGPNFTEKSVKPMARTLCQKWQKIPAWCAYKNVHLTGVTLAQKPAEPTNRTLRQFWRKPQARLYRKIPKKHRLSCETQQGTDQALKIEHTASPQPRRAGASTNPVHRIHRRQNNNHSTRTSGAKPPQNRSRTLCKHRWCIRLNGCNDRKQATAATTGTPRSKRRIFRRVASPVVVCHLHKAVRRV